MVKNQDDKQSPSVGTQTAGKAPGGQQKPEQQMRNKANRNSYNQNPRRQNQSRQQSGGQSGGQGAGQGSGQSNGQGAGAQGSSPKESYGYNHNQPTPPVQKSNQSNNQSQTRGVAPVNRNQTDRKDVSPRDNGQNRANYREKNKENDRDCRPRQYSGTSSTPHKYGNSLRNRAEETIDDIKEDIIRIEKEIDLEIKEIKSMKL